MKIIFAGTPGFAARCLEALIDAPMRVELVLTQPDRPAGRGLKIAASAVKRLAQDHGIRVLQPPSLKDAAIQELLRKAGADVMVVAAYGLILPQAVLDIPRLGAINVHASLLPRWRGPAPIQRALLAGDNETGVSIMRLDAGLDTGPVMLREAVAIRAEDNAQTLHDRLAGLGAKLLIQALGRMDRNLVSFEPQAAEGVTYASKIDKGEARVDWRQSANEIWRKIRAFDPHPGACSRIAGTEVKIWNAAPAAGKGSPGEVLETSSAGILVACGEGALLLRELQRSGGRRLAAKDLLHGRFITPGARFED